MADVKKIATRQGYGEALRELGALHGDIVVFDADLAGSTQTGVFGKAFPDRHFNCGIAEGNMMAAAAGAAAMGMVAFASSFAMFAAGRAYEQVRNSIAYPRLNVKLAMTHAGVSVGEDGGSHQCVEDLALMRAIPGMTVICPADASETRRAVFAAAEMDGPVYLRLARLASPVFEEEQPFEIGRANVLREGADVAVFATGLMVSESLAAAKLLEERGVSAAVINVHTIKPIDAQRVTEYAQKCGRVVTVEEHSVIGGLGEAVCALLSEKCPTPVRRIGVNDEFGHSGPAAALLKQFGLSSGHIVETAKEFCGK